MRRRDAPCPLEGARRGLKPKVGSNLSHLRNGLQIGRGEHALKGSVSTLRARLLVVVIAILDHAPRALHKRLNHPPHGVGLGRVLCRRAPGVRIQSRWSGQSEQDRRVAVDKAGAVACPLRAVDDRRHREAVCQIHRGCDRHRPAVVEEIKVAQQSARGGRRVAQLGGLEADCADATQLDLGRWRDRVGVLPVHEAQRRVARKLAHEVRMEWQQLVRCEEAGSNHLNVAQRILRIGPPDCESDAVVRAIGHPTSPIEPAGRVARGCEVEVDAPSLECNGV